MRAVSLHKIADPRRLNTHPTEYCRNIYGHGYTYYDYDNSIRLGPCASASRVRAPQGCITCPTSALLRGSGSVAALPPSSAGVNCKIRERNVRFLEILTAEISKYLRLQITSSNSFRPSPPNFCTTDK